MRKVLALAVLLVPCPVFAADLVCTFQGCVGANEGGHLVVVDGDASNPDPADGFVSVSDDGVVCIDDNGTADDGNPNNGPESTSPTCVSASSVCVPSGPSLVCISANQGGHLLVVDGDAANPDPADGFVSVSKDGVVCTDDNGTADDGDPTNGPESDSPSCVAGEFVCTALACVRVNEDGYVIVVDGDASNPDPGDGFVAIRNDGVACIDDNGTADESTSPTCIP
jgi:hypothetical protein